MQRKVDYKNYEQKLWGKIITGNYEEKLSASIYHQAKNVGIIGILVYLKTLAKKLHIQKVHPCNILFLSSNFVNVINKSKINKVIKKTMTIHQMFTITNKNLKMFMLLNFFVPIKEKHDP